MRGSPGRLPLSPELGRPASPAARVIPVQDSVLGNQSLAVRTPLHGRPSSLTRLDRRARQRFSRLEKKWPGPGEGHLSSRVPGPPILPGHQRLLAPLVPCPLQELLVFVLADLFAAFLDDASHAIPPFIEDSRGPLSVGLTRSPPRQRAWPLRPLPGGSGTSPGDTGASGSSAPRALRPWR